MIKEFLKEISGIHFIDVGSSGSLDKKWKNLEPFIHLTGFDPNKEECERMQALPHQFKSLNYLPYAIAGSKGVQTLYKTNSIYCYSLLQPNTAWLNRFEFNTLFERAGEEEVNTVKLTDIDEFKNGDTDIIKVDTQGLELPILTNAGVLLQQAFFVETETGFVENYIGESTYAEIDLFMRSKGFLLFDINTTHRIARDNHFKETPSGAEQILWCEATWMKDYVTLINNGSMNAAGIVREKALKILIICGLQGCVDYGYELAVLFNQLHLIDADELKTLADKKAWLLKDEPQMDETVANHRFSLLNGVLRLLPGSIRTKISNAAQLAAKQKHLFHG